MVSLDVERILCNQEVLGTRICRGYQKVMRTLPSKLCSILGPQEFSNLSSQQTPGSHTLDIGLTIQTSSLCLR